MKRISTTKKSVIAALLALTASLSTSIAHADGLMTPEEYREYLKKNSAGLNGINNSDSVPTNDGKIHYNKKCVESWTLGNSSKSDLYKGIWCCQIPPLDGEIDRELIDKFFKRAKPAC